MSRVLYKIDTLSMCALHGNFIGIIFSVFIRRCNHMAMNSPGSAAKYYINRLMNNYMSPNEKYFYVSNNW